MNQSEQLIFGSNPVSILPVIADTHLSAEELLNSLLADTYRLIVNNQGLRWNVQGALFQSVRDITRRHANELYEAIDVIAERIRSLNAFVPHQFDAMPDMSALDDVAKTKTIEVQIDELADAHEQVAARIKAYLLRSSDPIRDPKTSAVLTERAGAHEQQAWMLRALVS